MKYTVCAFTSSPIAQVTPAWRNIGPQTPYFWPIALTLGVLLLCASLYLLWRWRARRQANAAGKQDNQALAQQVWREWQRFVKRLPETRREQPVVVVISAPHSESATMIDGFLGWRENPELLRYFEGSTGKAHFYAGQHVLVAELGADLVSSKDPALHKVLGKIWRSMPWRLGVVVVALPAASLDRLNPQAQELGEFLPLAHTLLESLRAQVPGQRIRLRLCVTKANELAGYPSVCHPALWQPTGPIELRRLDGGPDQGLSHALHLTFSPPRVDFDLAARTLPAEAFTALLDLQERLPDVAGALDGSFRLLAGAQVAAYPLESVAFCTEGQKSALGQPLAFDAFELDHVRRHLQNLKIARTATACALAVALITGVHIEHLALVQRAQQQVERLQAAPPLVQAFANSIEQTRALAEHDAGTALLALFDAEILWTKRTAHLRKQRLRLHYRQEVEEQRLLPVLHSEEAGASAKLAALAFLYAGSDPALRQAMAKDLEYWATLSGLPSLTAQDYSRLSNEAWASDLASVWQPPQTNDLPGFSGDWAHRLHELEEAFSASTLDEQRVNEVRETFPATLLADTREHFAAIAEVAGRLGQVPAVRTALGDTVARGEMAGWVDENYETLARLLAVVHGQSPEDQVVPRSLAELRRRLSALAQAQRGQPRSGDNPLVLLPPVEQNGEPPPPSAAADTTAVDDPNANAGKGEPAPPTANQAAPLAAPQVLTLRLGERTYAFDVQRWRALTSSMAAQNLITRYLEEAGKEPQSAFMTATTRQANIGQLRGATQGPSGEIDGRLTKAHFRAVVAPTLDGLAADLRQWQESGVIDETSRIELSTHIIAAVDDYAQAYRSAYDAYCASVAFFAATPQQLYQQIDLLTYSKSWLIDFLALVAEQTDLAVDESDPFLEPLALALVGYQPLHLVMTPEKGAYPNLAPFIQSYVDLIAQMQAHTPSDPNDPQAKITLSSRMSALGAITLATLRGKASDARIDMRKRVTLAHLPSEIGKVLQDPIDRFYELGQDEVNKTFASLWYQQVLPALKPVVLAFPFTRDASASLPAADLTALLGPKGTFRADLQQKLGEALAANPDDPWRLLDGLRAPQDFIATLQEIDRLSRTLWDDHGKARAIAMRVTFLPLTQVQVKERSAKLAYLSAGSTRVSGFNERPTEKVLDVAWAQEGPASLGLVFGSPSTAQADLQFPIAIEPQGFAFYRLLASAQPMVAVRYRLSWSIALPAPTPAASLIVEFDRDPWLDFALPVTARSLGIGGI